MRNDNNIIIIIASVFWKRQLILVRFPLLRSTIEQHLSLQPNYKIPVEQW